MGWVGTPFDLDARPRAGDALPIVAHRKKVSSRSVHKGTGHPGAGAACVLKFIDHHQLKGAAPATRLQVVRRQIQHVLEVNDALCGQLLLPGLPDGDKQRQEDLMPESELACCFFL